MPLTTQAIKAAAVGTTIRDDKVTGLHVRITKTKRTFYLYYRTRDRKERRPRIGDFPVMSIPAAREIAEGWLRRVAEGGDPVAEWKAAAELPTVDDLCDRYETDHGADKKSWRDDESKIRRHIRPRLGRKRVAEITYDDIYKLHRSLKTTPYEANRTHALLSKMFNLAERWALRPKGSNPCNGVPRFRERRRKRHASVDEVGKIGAVLYRERERHPRPVAFIYLMILTGARRGEIAAAKWSDIRGDRIVLSEHKTDGSGEERVVRLPEEALEVLRRLPRTKGTITGIKSPRRLWESVREEAGCLDLRLHDLRHSFASVALSMPDGSLDRIGELLGHKSIQTTRGYSHLMEDPAAKLAADTAARVAELMRPKSA